MSCSSALFQHYILIGSLRLSGVRFGAGGNERLPSFPFPPQPPGTTRPYRTRLLHRRLLRQPPRHVNKLFLYMTSSHFVVITLCSRFIIKDKDTFFSQAQRSLMVYENLLRARYEESREKFGIDRLVKSQTYLAAFPLHDVSVTS